MKTVYLLVCLFIGSTVCAQVQRTKVIGKIVAKTRNLEDVYVQNKTTNQYVVTEAGGYFNISAQAGDTLILAGMNLVGRNKVLTYADMNKTLLLVPMETSRFMLDELVIDRTINAVSLGLPTGKVPTAAQRRLYTATSSSGGILAVDRLVNALSGRTKMLEKAVAYEEEENLVHKIINRFPDEFYTKELHIPDIYITAYGYFLAQDREITDALGQGMPANKMKFLYLNKVGEFLELIKVLQ